MKLKAWTSPDGRLQRVYVNIPDHPQIYAQIMNVDGIRWCGPPGTAPGEVKQIAVEGSGDLPLSFASLKARADAVPSAASPRRAYSDVGKTHSSGNTGFARVGDGYTSADTMRLDPAKFSIPFLEPTRLIVDHREPDEIAARLALVPNLIIEREMLDVGDYVVPGQLIIERKTTNDFHTSMTEDSKRLLGQANAMALTGTPSLFLIEGGAYQQKRLSIEAITGTQSWMIAILGIGVIETIDLSHSVYTIATLVKHTTHGLGYEIGLREGEGKRTARGHADLTASYILESVPGLSATKAGALLAHFGSLRAVANAEPATLTKVKGIGAEMSRRIAEAFAVNFAEK